MNRKPISVSKYTGTFTEFVVNPQAQQFLEHLSIDANSGCKQSKAILRKINDAFETLEELACCQAGIKISKLFVREKLLT